MGRGSSKRDLRRAHPPVARSGSPPRARGPAPRVLRPCARARRATDRATGDREPIRTARTNERRALPPSTPTPPATRLDPKSPAARAKPVSRCRAATHAASATSQSSAWMRRLGLTRNAYDDPSVASTPNTVLNARATKEHRRDLQVVPAQCIERERSEPTDLAAASQLVEGPHYAPIIANERRRAPRARPRPAKFVRSSRLPRVRRCGREPPRHPAARRAACR